MKRPRITRRTLLIGLAVAALAFAAIKTWGVPAIITAKLRARYGGDISYSGWWLGRSSAGLNELALAEGPSPLSPIWARAARVVADLTIGGMIRGRTEPREISLIDPRIKFRLGPRGEPLTRPPLKSGRDATIPTVHVESGRVEIVQEGRPAMIVEPVFATMSPGGDGEILSARVDSPVWGKWTADGSFSRGFASGSISLRSETPLIADRKKTAMIPFVPAEVWEHVAPRGPVRVAIDVTTGEKPSVVTRGEFLGASLHLPTLDLIAEGATGRMTIRDRVVTIEGAKGQALGGEVDASGTLDFSQEPPRVDIKLDLKGVDVAAMPKRWGLADAGITGRLTGTAHLRVALTKDGADPTGTEGSAVVENATVSGIAMKSLKLTMKAEGETIKYEQVVQAAPAPVVESLPIVALALIAPPLQDEPKKGGFVFPKTLQTEVEFADTDLAQFVAKARALGIPLPFAVSGKLSLKAKATIPLGALRDAAAYVFHGQARLKAASIAGVDIGSIEAKLDFDKGVLDLTDLRGRLVDRPDDRAANPPAEMDLPPIEGPLPKGGFRGHLRAEISPRGKLAVSFEGHELPIGELAAPALPRPTPLSGLVSFRFTADGDTAHLDDPKAWTIDAHVDGERIRYRETTLDRLASSLTIKDGRAAMPNISASLEGRTLQASFAMDAVAPYDFNATLRVDDWDMDSLLALVPSMPRPAPVGGVLDLRLKANGALKPRSLAIEGEGVARKFRAGSVMLGDIPIRLRTEPERVRVTVEQGGAIQAEADIPTSGDGPIRGTATIRRLDLSSLAAIRPKTATISGHVDGKGSFVVRPNPKPGESNLDGDLRLTAPDLTVQGVPARAFQVVFEAAKGVLKYEAYAEALGGKMDFKGGVPLTGPNPEASGELRAVAFRLEGLWKPMNVGGAVAKLEALAAIDANMLMHMNNPDLRARGLAEVRDLRWGPDYPIGRLKGVITLTPEGWRVDRLTGDVLGGSARGSAVAERSPEGPQHLSAELQVDRASLRQTLAFVPALAAQFDGQGSLRLSGRIAETVRLDGEFSVPEATVMGLPVQELRAPGELEFIPGGGLGTLRVRRWNARFAGGKLTGDARLGVGEDRSFTLDNTLAAIDLESMLRVLTDARRPASGKVSGRATISGTDPARLETLRGRIDLDLHDASLVEMPVFRELERFLGSARGGVFDKGELHATIGNRQVAVENLTLVGRLVQLHATGTVGFDQRIDMVVVVNTNQLIRETGQALVALVGLRELGGRRALASARFADYLSNRLLKFRVGGTIASPTVDLDPALAVGEGAVGFFAGVLKLPLELFR